MPCSFSPTYSTLAAAAFSLQRSALRPFCGSHSTLPSQPTLESYKKFHSAFHIPLVSGLAWPPCATSRRAFAAAHYQRHRIGPQQANVDGVSATSYHLERRLQVPEMIRERASSSVEIQPVRSAPPCRPSDSGLPVIKFDFQATHGFQGP